MSKLAKQGTQVIIPYRDLTWALPLKVSGDLGMTVLHVRLLGDVFDNLGIRSS